MGDQRREPILKNASACTAHPGPDVSPPNAVETYLLRKDGRDRNLERDVAWRSRATVDHRAVGDVEGPVRGGRTLPLVRALKQAARPNLDLKRLAFSLGQSIDVEESQIVARDAQLKDRPTIARPAMPPRLRLLRHRQEPQFKVYVFWDEPWDRSACLQLQRPEMVSRRYT